MTLGVMLEVSSPCACHTSLAKQGAHERVGGITMCGLGRKAYPSASPCSFQLCDHRTQAEGLFIPHTRSPRMARRRSPPSPRGPCYLLLQLSSARVTNILLHLLTFVSVSTT